MSETVDGGRPEGSSNWVEQALRSICADEPGVKVYVEWHRRRGWAELSMLQVPMERRGQGVARRVVGALVAAADRAGVALAVTPTDEFGSDLERLRAFYVGFGFVRNAGGDRDWDCRADYIRPWR